MIGASLKVVNAPFFLLIRSMTQNRDRIWIVSFVIRCTPSISRARVFFIWMWHYLPVPQLPIKTLFTVYSQYHYTSQQSNRYCWSVLVCGLWTSVWDSNCPSGRLYIVALTVMCSFAEPIWEKYDFLENLSQSLILVRLSLLNWQHGMQQCYLKIIYWSYFHHICTYYKERHIL